MATSTARSTTQAVRRGTASSAQPRQAIPLNNAGVTNRTSSAIPRTARVNDPAAFRYNNHSVSRVHPRERDFIDHGHLGHFYGHHPHYFGYRVHALPPRYHTIVRWGHTYYYYDNIYYRYRWGHYIVCRPPFGVIVDAALEDLALFGLRFAYYSNAYRTFDVINDNYRAINEQNRIIAENNATIASQNSNLVLNDERALSAYEIATSLGLVQSFAYANQEYFYQDGVFYIKNKDGNYEVIIPPAGALVTELPDDYETVVLNGVQYYKVDDTVYRTTVVDGTPYLEVLGQTTVDSE